MRWNILIVVILSAGMGVTMPPQQEYAIWMTPSGTEYHALQQVICELAERYPSPCFAPHMTVVSGVEGSLEEVTQLAEELAQRTGPLNAVLPRVQRAIPDEYHRSFYLRVKETAAFARLYEDTCNIVGKCHEPPYHISLMYTDEVSRQERARLRDRLYGAERLPRRVQLDRLRVCNLKDLKPEEWQCPVEIRLNNRA